MKLPAHVFYYSLVIGISTAAAVGISRAFGTTDDEKRKVLESKFPDRTRNAETSQKQMQVFFDQLKDPSKSEEFDKKLNGVLHAGKGDMRKVDNIKSREPTNQ